MTVKFLQSILDVKLRSYFIHFLKYIFQHNFFIDSLGPSHCAPSFCSCPSLPHLPLIFAASPTENFLKTKTKPSNQTSKNFLPCLSHVPRTSSFILVPLGVLVCHTAYHARGNESLVWFKAFIFLHHHHWTLTDTLLRYPAPAPAGY